MRASRGRSWNRSFRIGFIRWILLINKIKLNQFKFGSDLNSSLKRFKLTLSIGFTGRVISFKLGLKSSREALRFRRLSKDDVKERLAFIKMVLPPPRYWFKNSDLFSTVSWTCLPCFISQWARSNIIRNSFCSLIESVSTPRNFVRTTICSSSSNCSILKLLNYY